MRIALAVLFLNCSIHQSHRLPLPAFRICDYTPIPCHLYLFIFWFFRGKSTAHNKFPLSQMQSILKACRHKTGHSEPLQVSMTRKTLSDCKLFSLLSSCQMIFLILAHAYTGQTNACLFGHMWGNKCNYKQDVIAIALLLKLLYAVMV